MITLNQSDVGDTLTNFEQHAVSIKSPNVLKSPIFEVEPLTYYRLVFDPRTNAKSFWAVVFYDALGQMLLADVYSCFDLEADSRTHTFYFQSKVDATSAEFWMRPNGEGSQVELSSVQISLAAGQSEIVGWADSI